MRWVGLACLLLLALSSASVRADPSSYSRDGDGAKVLYLFLADLGYQVARGATLDALDEAPKGKEFDVLVVLGSAKAPTLARAATWARGAGKLLIYAAPLVEQESRQYCEGVDLGPLRVARQRKLSSKEPKRATGYGDLKVRPSACVATPPAGATALAEGELGAIVFSQQLERGRLLFFAHDDLLRNLYLDEGDLAVLLRRYLHQHLRAGARVLFFEQRSGGKLWEMLQRANMLPLLAHSLLLLLLIYWRVTPRFGDPTPARPPGRRAFAEHARALGGLYQRAGASGYALQQLYDRFLEKMRARERGAHGGGTEREALAARLATRANRPVEKVRSLLLEVEHAAAMKGTKDKSAASEDFRLGRALAQLAGEADGRRHKERS